MIVKALSEPLALLWLDKNCIIIKVTARYLARKGPETAWSQRDPPPLDV